MPGLLTGGSAGAAQAIVQYLATLKPKAALKLKPSRHVNAARGKELFHTVGCVSCHAPRPGFAPAAGTPGESDFTYASHSFPDLSGKTNVTVLADFLLNPLKLRPSGRMPKLLSSEDDAMDIAGYLLDFEPSDGRLSPEIRPLAANPELVALGRTLVAQARCAACHELPKEVAATLVKLQKQSGGCLDAAPPQGSPRYELSAPQRAALLLHLASASALTAPERTADLTLQALNCAACHERNGSGGPDSARKAYFQGDHNLGDTGLYPPPLTAVGRKLQPDWLEKVLSGENRVRPYLKTRMPVYGEAVSGLGPLLARADARAPRQLPGGDDAAGRKLLGTMGGIGCITCHPWGERASLGIQALDLSNLGQRIQPDWLYEYLLDPAAYRPGTLMPAFWPGGKAANTEVLAGDTAKQIASIYSFAKSANGEPEGFPQTQNGEFELLPRERPIVQRTFMEGVGTHAILVGFPEGAHLAYDAKGARPALAWTGRFFDAYNTWFSRFAPFEKPAGERVVHWPNSWGTPASRFLGYRLDAGGIPIFMHAVAGLSVDDRFEGVLKGLRRTISWSGRAATQPPIQHPSGVTVKEEASHTQSQRTFTYLWE
jgi:mono/diheme cytochrome c family protein